MFQHFDKKGYGKITLEEFKKGLYEKNDLEGKMRFYLNDFMTPLQSVMRDLKNKSPDMTPATVFSLFAKGDKKYLTIADFK